MPLYGLPERSDRIQSGPSPRVVKQPPLVGKVTNMRIPEWRQVIKEHRNPKDTKNKKINRLMTGERNPTSEQLSSVSMIYGGWKPVDPRCGAMRIPECHADPRV